jgi:hypothetical protein
MSPRRNENLVSLLNPISDERAKTAVSPEMLADLTAAVMQVPIATRPHGRPRVRIPRPRRALVLALAAGAVAGALAVTEAMVGHGPSIAQPADAAILRGVDAVLHPAAGSIITESFTRVTACRNLTCRRSMEAAHDPRTFRFSDMTETAGVRRVLILVDSTDHRYGVETLELPSGHELYDPRANTVYRFNYYAHGITPGPTPGTFIYRLPSGWMQLASLPYGSDVVSAAPLTITARQAQALRRGTARIAVLTTPTGQHRLQVAPALPPFPYETPSASARQDLGPLKVAGHAMVNSHKAIRLVPIHGAGEFDVAPGTLYPLREIEVTPEAIVTTTWTEYRVLPGTSGNQALMSLTARHPSARIDDSNHDYWAAMRRLTRGD